MMHSNKNAKVNYYEDSSNNKIMNIELDTSPYVFNLDCKLNQYPSNKKLFQLLTYNNSYWGLDTSLMDANLIKLGGKIEDLKDEASKSRRATKIKFSQSPNNVDYLDEDTDYIEDRKEVLFNYINIEVTTPEASMSGDLCLINSKIRISFRPGINLIKTTISLDTSKQDSLNHELYKWFLELPKDPLNEGLVCMEMLNSGLSFEYMDICRNYLADEYLSCVLKELMM